MGFMLGEIGIYLSSQIRTVQLSPILYLSPAGSNDVPASILRQTKLLEGLTVASKKEA